MRASTTIAAVLLIALLLSGCDRSSRVRGGGIASVDDGRHVDSSPVHVDVDRDASHCSVERVPMACNQVAFHLRDTLRTPLSDPIVVSPYFGEFVTDMTSLVATNIGEAGYRNVTVIGEGQWNDAASN